MTFQDMRKHIMSQAGNAAVIILVVVAGIAVGVFLFSRYDATSRSVEGDVPFPDIAEEADLDSMRERLEEIRDEREARETDEEAGVAANTEDEAAAGGDDEEESHADERGEDTTEDPYGPTGPGGGDAEESQEDESGHVAYSGTRLAGTAELPMLRFNQADYDRAVAANETIVLMFHANWCPLCQAEEPDARAAFDQLAAEGVDGVVGFRVHFDDEDETPEEKALAEQYNVQFQSSKIIVSNGSTVSQASYQRWSIAQYKSAIQAAI